MSKQVVLLKENVVVGTFSLPFSYGNVHYGINTSQQNLNARGFYGLVQLYYTSESEDADELFPCNTLSQEDSERLVEKSAKLVSNTYQVIYHLLTEEEFSAKEKEAQQQEMLRIRNQCLSKYPDLQNIFDTFLNICSIITGKSTSDPTCKLGFQTLITLQKTFLYLPEAEQVAIITRAMQAGFTGTPVEILSAIATVLIPLNMQGLRYDILDDELRLAGGWWAIC